VKLALDVEQPSRVKIRGEKLDIYERTHGRQTMQRAHQICQQVRQVSNYWKYFIGQQRGLKRLHVQDKKKAQEDRS
jgi:hypothetical protein